MSQESFFDTKRGNIFSYFNLVDRDGSGMLEKPEVEYVIKLIMGEELNKEQITTYVDSVFSKFDVNNSGKLDFAESRGLIRSLVEFF